MVKIKLTPKELEVIQEHLLTLSTLTDVEAGLWEKIDDAIPMEFVEVDEV